MKEILLKLTKGDNHFEIVVFGQKTTGEIIKLDLWGLKDGKGRALFRLKNPVKKTVRKEVEHMALGIDSESSYYEDVVVDTYEEWLSVGY